MIFYKAHYISSTPYDLNFILFWIASNRFVWKYGDKVIPLEDSSVQFNKWYQFIIKVKLE